MTPHPALDGYPIDDDYMDVDNDTPSSDVAREQMTRQPPPPDVDYSHLHDDSSGHGASEWLDDKRDEDAVIENDNRSVTRTFFYPTQDNDENDKYKRLLQYNEGMWDEKRATRNNAADDRRWIDGFCSVLESSDYVQDRAQLIVESVNMKEMGPYSSQQVVLAVVMMVEREERIRYGGTMMMNDERFHTLLQTVRNRTQSDDMTAIRNIASLVRRKSPMLDGSDE